MEAFLLHLFGFNARGTFLQCITDDVASLAKTHRSRNYFYSGGWMWSGMIGECNKKDQCNQCSYVFSREHNFSWNIHFRYLEFACVSIVAADGLAVLLSLISCQPISRYGPWIQQNYHQTSNISHTKSQNLNVSCLAVIFAQSIEARC